MIKQLKILFLIIVILGLFFILFKRKSEVEIKENFFEDDDCSLGILTDDERHDLDFDGGELLDIVRSRLTSQTIIDCDGCNSREADLKDQCCDNNLELVRVFPKSSDNKTIKRGNTTCINYMGAIIIANIVEILGTNSFSFHNLTALITESGSQLTTINDASFIFCTDLKVVDLTNATRLLQLGTKQDTVSVDVGVFEECSKLESVELPNSVKTFGNATFKNCEKLTSFTIPPGVTRIGVEAFAFDNDNTPSRSRPKGLTTINLPRNENFTIIEEGTFKNCIFLKSISIPRNVTDIHDEVFENCNSLTTVIFEQSSNLQSIGARAFKNCQSLESIIIPRNVTTIGMEAFRMMFTGSGFLLQTNKLTNITFEGTSQLGSIDEKAFFENRATYSIIIPDSVTSIGKQAFALDNFSSNERGLERITLPTNDDFKVIDENLFQFCTGLRTITIPSSVTNIEDGAFQFCRNLTTVEFEENSNLERIGENAFQACRNLKSIIIPPNVKTIDTGAFNSCTILSEIFLPSSLTELGDNVFLETACFKNNFDVENINDIDKVRTHINQNCPITCNDDEFITATQSVDSITQCQQIDISCPTGNFISETAKAGESNIQCTPHSTCPVGKFITSQGTGESDTVCTDGSACPDGKFITLPASGDSDTQCKVLTRCGENEFISKTHSVNSDRECTTYRTCPTNEYISVTKSAFSDRECTPKSTCSVNEFITVPATDFSDNVCKDLSTCGDNEFISRTHSVNSDRECTTYRTCPTNQFISEQGGESSDHQCSDITPCPTDQYITVPAVAGINNNQCADLTRCNFETQFITLRATEDRDRVCAPLTNCNSNEYISFRKSDFSDRQCTPKRTCSANQFITVQATEFSDNVCKELTQCNFDTQFISTPHTPNSDRICTDLTECREDEFIESQNTDTSDRICQQVTPCPTNQFITVQAIPGEVDQQCADITTCPVNKFVNLFPTPGIGNSDCRSKNCDHNELIDQGLGRSNGRWWTQDSTEINSKKRCVPKGDIAVKIQVKATQGEFLIKTSNNIDPSVSSKEFYNQLKLEPIIQKSFSEIFNTDFWYAGMNKETVNPFAHNIHSYFVGTSPLSKFDSIAYIFDLRVSTVLEEFSKHKYLDNSKIDDILTNKDKNENVYLFVIGKREERMNLYKAKHCIFSIVYQNNINDQTSFIFEFINYDLKLFYEYNRNFDPTNKNLWDIYLEKKKNITPILDESVKYKTGIDILNAECKILKDDIPNVTGSVQLGEPNDFVVSTIIIRETHKTFKICSFEAQGDTLFECKRLCKKNESCSRSRCNKICDNCTNEEKCMWNQLTNVNNSLLLPESAVIKGFKGDRHIRITWVKPPSNTIIENYYIIVTSPVDTDFLEIHSVSDNRELLDYIIADLTNDISYNIILFTKNTIGIGKKSNIITVIPSKDSPSHNKINDTFSDSLENKRNKEISKFKLNKKINNFEKNKVINDLKKIIEKDLDIVISKDKNFKINIT